MKFYKTIVQPFLGMLTPGDRKKGVWIIVLMVFNAILDFFSLASFLPLLFFVINPEFISTNAFVNKLYSFFKFSTPAIFIMTLTAGVLLFVLVKNLISAWIASMKARYAFGISNNLSSRALGRYLEMSHLTFSQCDFTRELNRITNYPFAFANNMVLPMTSLISEGFVSILILIGIAFYDYKVLFLLLTILLPMLLLYRLRRNRLKEINQDLKEKYPLLLKYALQVIEGFSEIKASGKENYFHERFRKMSKNVTKVFIKDQFIQSSTIRLTEIIVGIILCFLIIYSVSTQQHYQQTLLLLGVYAGASFRVIPSVNRILHSTQQIRTHEHLLEELSSLINYHYPQPKSSSPVIVLSKTIELKNISFAYPSGTPILQNTSLLIRKGEKVALTGKSGEGKTTLLLILLRFLKETEGEIRVDDHPIQNEMAWRKLIGYVPQNPYILDGTVAENIAFGIPAEEIDNKKVLRLISELDLNEMINQLSHGIDTQIGERGIKLSGGQRQRLAIARALYADADILLLDEITNQVHTFMEKEILNILEDLANKKKTIIMVTHKLTGASFFDSIYSLEKGKLHEVVMQP